MKKNFYYVIKRIIDFIIALTGLFLCFPILIIISLAIKIDSKGSVFYKHKRIGKNGKYIYLYKFRSMVYNAKEIFDNFTLEQKREYQQFFKLKNDPRITKIGEFLRSTSLDELPQLINILKGDMALIGPRPIVDEEIKKYKQDKDLFLSVLPGLTGWWACNGRSDLTYEERIELELYYVRNCSLKLDVICFFKTIVSVFKKVGAK